MLLTGLPPASGPAMWRATGRAWPRCLAGCGCAPSRCSLSQMTCVCRLSGAQGSRCCKDIRQQRQHGVCTRALSGCHTRLGVSAHQQVLCAFAVSVCLSSSGCLAAASVHSACCAVVCSCRLEFASVVQLEAEGAQACVVGVNKVTKMKPNMADVPYTVERHKPSSWVFSLTYAKLDSFMPLAQEQLVISRLPAADR